MSEKLCPVCKGTNPNCGFLKPASYDLAEFERQLDVAMGKLMQADAYSRGLFAALMLVRDCLRASKREGK